MEEHHLTVPRTARYHTLGDADSATHIWIALHGYGQLARFFLRPFTGSESGKLIAAPEGLSRYYTDAEHSRVGATWMTREDPDHEIADQISYLDRLVEHLRSLCPPGIPVSVLGFSQSVATDGRYRAKPHLTRSSFGEERFLPNLKPRICTSVGVIARWSSYMAHRTRS